METRNISEIALQNKRFEVNCNTRFVFGLDMREMHSEVDITHEFVFSKADIKVEIEYRFISGNTFSFKNKVNLIAPEGIKNVYGHLTMKSLVLSDNTSSTFMPFLQIDERDVDVDHSVSMGSIDKEILFYFSSRGINSDDAKDIIAKEFIKFEE